MVANKSHLGTTQSPTKPVVIEEIDPSRMDEYEWNAGSDEWMREGHDDLATVPLERPKWQALLRRRAARLERETAAAEKLKREKHRQNIIDSLTPPPCDPIVNGKDICDAEAALSEAKESLYEAWHAKFDALQDDVRAAWIFNHVDIGEGEFWEFYLRPHPPVIDDFPTNPAEIRRGLANPEYRRFQAYSSAVWQRIEQLEANLERALNPPAGMRPPLKGWALNEINENEGSRWPVPGVIPHGLTFVYGLPKGGKSLWMQKLSACIAGGAPFDGVNDLEHGRVLYITRDIGASRQEVKKRLMKILPRLDLPDDALDRKLVLTDDPFYLNDPTSVDNLLVHNPGRFVLVVIDSLFRCVVGSLSQDVVASAAVDAIDRISRATGAAIVAVHHEPRGGEHLFGSVMLDAAYDAQIHVERGKERNSVVVTVQELKNAPIPDKPFRYEIEQEYLAPAGSTASASKNPDIDAAPRRARHEQMLAQWPAGWFTRKEGRKLVESLLAGKTEAARRKQWGRAISEMTTAGQLTVRGRQLRKT
jgi:hypothetical protein